MSFFRIRKELQLRVCNHEKPHANPCTSRKAEPFYRRGRKLGGLYYTKSPRLFIGRVFAKKGVFLLPVGLCYGSLRAPPSGLLTLFNWNICLLFFNSRYNSVSTHSEFSKSEFLKIDSETVLKSSACNSDVHLASVKRGCMYWCMDWITHRKLSTNTYIPDSSSIFWAHTSALSPCSGTESLPGGNESSLPLCTN